MANLEMAAVHPSRAPLARPVEPACFALIVAHAVYPVASCWNGVWLAGSDGHGVPNDFVNVWAAGQLVLE